MINIYVYDNEGMEGDPFHVFSDAKYNTTYKLEGLESDTTYYVVLKDENDEIIKPSEKSQTQFTTQR